MRIKQLSNFVFDFYDSQFGQINYIQLARLYLGRFSMFSFGVNIRVNKRNKNTD